MHWISTELALPVLRHNNESESDEVLVWIVDGDNQWAEVRRLQKIKPDEIYFNHIGHIDLNDMKQLVWQSDYYMQEISVVSFESVKYWMPITEPSEDLRIRQLESA